MLRLQPIVATTDQPRGEAGERALDGHVVTRRKLHYMARLKRDLHTLLGVGCSRVGRAVLCCFTGHSPRLRPSLSWAHCCQHTASLNDTELKHCTHIAQKRTHRDAVRVHGIRDAHVLRRHHALLHAPIVVADEAAAVAVKGVGRSGVEKPQYL